MQSFMLRGKKIKFGTKNALFWFFGLEFERAIVIFKISTSDFVKKQCFMLKGKILNLGPKVPYFGNFELEIEKNIVIFEISTFEFVKMQSFMLHEKKQFYDQNCLS